MKTNVEVFKMVKKETYAKPALGKVEMEIESSLLLTTSDTKGYIGAQGLGSSTSSTQIANGGNYTATRR